MDEVDAVDELGPVDWIVVEFPGSRFNGQIAPALLDLVERDLVRVLDLLVLKKDADGTLAAIEPGSSAGVLIWENIWAAPFASAVRRSGGQLIASGRIPIQALLAAIEADEKEEAADEGTEQLAATEGEI
jgi:hypothetical protein